MVAALGTPRPSSRDKPRPPGWHGGSPSSKECPDPSQVHRRSGLKDARGDRGTKHQQIGSSKAESRVCPPLRAQSVARGTNNRNVLTSETRNKVETDWTDSRGTEKKTMQASSQEPSGPTHQGPQTLEPRIRETTASASGSKLMFQDPRDPEISGPTWKPSHAAGMGIGNTWGPSKAV